MDEAERLFSRGAVGHWVCWKWSYPALSACLSLSLHPSASAEPLVWLSRLLCQGAVFAGPGGCLLRNLAGPWSSRPHHWAVGVSALWCCCSSCPFACMQMESTVLSVSGGCLCRLSGKDCSAGMAIAVFPDFTLQGSSAEFLPRLLLSLLMGR